MKTVWRDVTSDECRVAREEGASEITSPATRHLSPIWTITAPGSDEKTHGKHPTQKPTALVERCLLASTNEGDLVLDPFLGNGTTAVASLRLKRGCVGIELDLHHVEMAVKRVKTEIEQKQQHLF
jgi:site-specific DNA-methyltransferase (adenine-specific)